MNEGLEAWTTPEPVPSLRNLEANPVRSLMEISLPGLMLSSTSSSQTGKGTSRLRELQERWQSRAREILAREERPPTWRDYPVRSVLIASCKKTTDGKKITGITNITGQRRSERRGMSSTTLLGLIISHSLGYPRVQSS